MDRNSINTLYNLASRNLRIMRSGSEVVFDFCEYASLFQKQFNECTEKLAEDRTPSQRKFAILGELSIGFFILGLIQDKLGNAAVYKGFNVSLDASEVSSDVACRSGDSLLAIEVSSVPKTISGLLSKSGTVTIYKDNKVIKKLDISFVDTIFYTPTDDSISAIKSLVESIISAPNKKKTLENENKKRVAKSDKYMQADLTEDSTEIDEVEESEDNEE